MAKVLITGASSGIGKELAYEFAKHKHDLLLVARRRELLEQLCEEIKNEYHVEVHNYACDVTKDIDALFHYCHENNLKIDVLINNAGYGDYGEFINSDIDKLLGMIELNNKALVNLTYRFVKENIDRGGHIINVGSVASFIPGPYMAVYYATKSFVLNFSLALREELKNKKFKVSVLCPAPTKTAFWDVANGQTTILYDNFIARSSKQAAKTGYKIYEKNKPYSIDGLAYKLIIGFARILPPSLSAKMVGNTQKITKK